MDEGTKLVVDVLYKEFARVRGKSVATDDWFFRFLSIAVVPFLASVAYALANPAYRIFLAALPFLSIIGVTVVLVLATHYIYATSYAEYLENRINKILGGWEVRELVFDERAYRKFSSPITLSYVLGIFILVVVNFTAIPIITLQFVRFRSTHPNLPRACHVLLDLYWPLVTVATTVFVVLGSIYLFYTRAACRRLAPRA